MGPIPPAPAAPTPPADGPPLASTADYPDLLFLATKSQDLINKQVESYRHRHGNSALIIKLVSVVPTGLIIGAVLLFLLIFRSQPLDQAFSHTQFQVLINKPYDQILLYEIAANTQSFADNSAITAKANKRYNRALIL